MVRNIRKSFGDLNVTISIVHEDSVFVQYESGFPYTETPRSVLLDAHTLLSRDWFYLSDTSKDWRTRTNPFVTGPPYIKSYYGVRLVSSSGVPIGVLAVFTSTPRRIEPSSLEVLSKYAARFMEYLETPYEVLELERNKKLLNQYSKNDLELIELSAKLGRATSTGGHLTIFERDGSGSAYSGNRIFKLNSNFALNRDRFFLPDSLANELTQKINLLNDEKDILTCLANSIARYEKLDFVCIIGIKVAFEVMERAKRTDVSLTLSKMKARPLLESGKMRFQVLAQSNENFDIAKTDIEIWQKTTASEYGYIMKAADDTSVFTCGVTLSVSGPDVRISSSTETGTESVRPARASTVVLGAFSKSEGVFSPLKISRIYDHAQIYLKACVKR